MRTKTIAAIVAAIIVMTHGMRALADDGLPGAAREWLAERREIVFAGQAAYPPFEFLDERNGEYTGMSVELIRWIATEYGFTATFVPMPFQDAQKAVLQGRADALTGFFESAERSIRYDFTRAVFSVPASIFARADRPDIRSVADLNGKRVAVQRGDYAIEYLTAASLFVEFVYTDDFRSALLLVASGQADALIGDEDTVRYYLRQERLEDTVHKASGALYVGKDCMAVAKGDAMLLAVLNAGIAKARSTGTLATIYRKWTGSALGSSGERSEMSTGALLAIGIAVAVAVSLAAAALVGRRAFVLATASLRTELASIRDDNARLCAENAGLRRDLEDRSRLEAAKRRIDAEAAARRVEELTRCAIAKALEPPDGPARES